MRRFGFDIGYGNSKVVADGTAIVFPSLVGPAKELAFTLGKEDQPGDVVEWEGQSYFVGYKACHSDLPDGFLRTRDWIESPLYAALLISAIRKAGISETNDETVMVTGLPVDYMGDKIKAEGVIRKVCDLEGINLVDIMIVPQPFGSFYDLVLTDEGQVREGADDLIRLGVVDVGYSTTDFVLVENRIDNIERAAGSIRKGAHDIYNMIARQLKIDFRKNDVSLIDAEEAVKTKTFRNGGQSVNVATLVNKILSQIGTHIQNIIISKWASEGDINKVLLTGGGSALLRQYISGIARVTELAREPQVANARGYCKRACVLDIQLSNKKV